MTTKKDNVAQAPADRMLVLTRIFNAPRPLVWEAWTKKEHLEKWSCPRGFTMPESRGDLRVGGEFAFVMIAPNGEKHACSGIYREIVTNELLEMTHGWLENDGSRPYETIVTVRFTDEGSGQTKMTLEQGIFKSVESRDGHNGGWSESFDKLAELLAGEDADFLITREFDAPRDLLWKVWTQPEHMARWWGPHGFTCPECEMEVRVGGAYRIVMTLPRGDFFPCKGVFREIVRPERLVMSMDLSEHPMWWFDMIKPDLDKTKSPTLDCVQTVTFEEVGGKTRLTVRMRFESPVVRETMAKKGMSEGWSESLEKMAELLAKLQTKEKS